MCLSGIGTYSAVETERITDIAVTPYQPNEKLHRLDYIIICRSSYYLIMEDIYTLLGLRSFRVYVLSSIRGISKPLFYAVCTDFRRLFFYFLFIFHKAIKKFVSICFIEKIKNHSANVRIIIFCSENHKLHNRLLV